MTVWSFRPSRPRPASASGSTEAGMIESVHPSLGRGRSGPGLLLAILVAGCATQSRPHDLPQIGIEFGQSVGGPDLGAPFADAERQFAGAGYPVTPGGASLKVRSTPVVGAKLRYSAA